MTSIMTTIELKQLHIVRLDQSYTFSAMFTSNDKAWMITDTNFQDVTFLSVTQIVELVDKVLSGKIHLTTQI